MCARIRTWSSRNLSYAGRLQLIKDILIAKQIDITGPKYSIKKTYEGLLQHGERQHWSKVVWCRSSLPKHQFTMWLGVRGRLLTRDRIIRLGFADITTCCFCSEIETHSHLFFSCPYSKKCLQVIAEWLGWSSGHS
ncbi:Structure-specific endonuclease subunit slx4 [Bienertia sinuspersici]